MKRLVAQSSIPFVRQRSDAEGSPRTRDQLVFITEDTERNTTDVKQLKTEVEALEQEVSELVSAVQRLDMELKHFREIERYERQQLASTLERTRLHFERRLPPPTRED